MFIKSETLDDCHDKRTLIGISWIRENHDYPEEGKVIKPERVIRFTCKRCKTALEKPTKFVSHNGSAANNSF